MGASGHLNLETMEYCVLDITNSRFIASDGHVGYQFFNSSIRLSSLDVSVLILAQLRFCIQDSSFLHLMNSAAFEYASVYAAFQDSPELAWTQWDSDERLLYCTFNSWSVHDVRNRLAKTCIRDTNGNAVIGRTMPSSRVLVVGLQDHIFMLNRTNVLGPVAKNKCERTSRSDNVIEHLSAIALTPMGRMSGIPGILNFLGQRSQV